MGRKMSGQLLVGGTASYYNCGASDDWADLHKFEIRALKLVAERLMRVGRPH